MTILTTAEIADLTAEHDAALIDTCVIRAAVETANPTVGNRYAWPTVTDTVDCAVQGRNAAVVDSGETDITMVDKAWRVILKRSPILTAPDHIEWNGLTLEVIDYTRTGTAYESSGVADCVEVRPDV